LTVLEAVTQDVGVIAVKAEEKISTAIGQDAAGP
jgi:hypothetical protein